MEWEIKFVKICLKKLKQLQTSLYKAWICPAINLHKKLEAVFLNLLKDQNTLNLLA